MKFCYQLLGPKQGLISFDITFSNKGSGTVYIYMNLPTGWTTINSETSIARLPAYVMGLIFWQATYTQIFLVNDHGGYPLATNTDEISGSATLRLQ